MSFSLTRSLLVLLLLPLVMVPPARSGSSPACVDGPETLVWFVQFGDTHIGASPEAATALKAFVETTLPILSPSFAVNVGDLTDSTNGGLIPNGPYLDEWIAYQGITASLHPLRYIDLAGNHDHYNAPDFAHYLEYSVLGANQKATQASWTREAGGYSYHFLGICTAGNDGAPFSLIDHNYGDHAGLDAEELTMVEAELSAHADARATLIFGHHPVDAWGTTGSDSLLTYGGEDLKALITRFNATCYGYGHTHDERQGLHPEGMLVFNTPAFCDTQRYALMALDGGGLSATAATSGSWPVVLITTPLSLAWGTADHAKGYAVSDSGPLRALVFDTAPPESVTYRIDGTGPWHPMDPASPGSPIWQATWEQENAHTLEVRAAGSTTRTARIFIGSPPTPPATGDPPTDPAPEPAPETNTPPPTDSPPTESHASGGGCFIKNASYGRSRSWFFVLRSMYSLRSCRFD